MSEFTVMAYIVLTVVVLITMWELFKWFCLWAGRKLADLFFGGRQ